MPSKKNRRSMRKKSRLHKQKHWMMIGCSLAHCKKCDNVHCKNSKCSSHMKGGTCSSGCSATPLLRGGRGDSDFSNLSFTGTSSSGVNNGITPPYSFIKGGTSTANMAYTGQPVHSISPPLSFTKGGKKYKGGNYHALPKQTNLFPNPISGGQKGGSTFDPQGLVGSPWTPSLPSWPGVAGSGSGNHFVDNIYIQDPQTINVINERYPINYRGGKQTRKNKKKQRGGFLIQDFMNGMRVGASTLGNGYNVLNGYPKAVSPLPFENQLEKTSALNSLQNALRS